MHGDLLYLAVFIALAALILVPSLWVLRPRYGRLALRGRFAGRGRDVY